MGPLNRPDSSSMSTAISGCPARPMSRLLRNSHFGVADDADSTESGVTPWFRAGARKFAVRYLVNTRFGARPAIGNLLGGVESGVIEKGTSEVGTGKIGAANVGLTYPRSVEIGSIDDCSLAE